MRKRPPTFCMVMEPDGMVARCALTPIFDEHGYVTNSKEFQTAAGFYEQSGLTLKPGQSKLMQMVPAGPVRRAKK